MHTLINTLVVTVALLTVTVTAQADDEENKYRSLIIGCETPQDFETYLDYEVRNRFDEMLQILAGDGAAKCTAITPGTRFTPRQVRVKNARDFAVKVYVYYQQTGDDFLSLYVAGDDVTVARKSDTDWSFYF